MPHSLGRVHDEQLLLDPRVRKLALLASDTALSEHLIDSPHIVPRNNKPDEARPPRTPPALL